ncbi:MAG: nickel-dependent lactate racemase [Alphaproteobacteria bacterium]|nr:nickel-dependent lactate racemase [Alphaproteobacteria bacterium]
MSVELAYGKSTLKLDLPEGVNPTVIRKTPLPIMADPAAAIREALDKPIGAPPLSQLARGKSSACILICDITRPVPNHLFLQPMIRDMMDAGIPAGRITVLVATGLHRPNEGAELAELVGDPWVLENVNVVNHFARNDEDHVDLGVTPKRGVAVKLDRRLVEADLRIATGLVEPHFMAGYSGGRKVVAPGVAHHETIRTFHNAKFMEDPAAVQCNLDGNPLHEEQLAIIRMLGEVYALNTVIDEDRNLINVTFGEIIESHLASVEFVRASTEVPVGRKFKTIVTSSAGYPLDKTYYQTVKAMVVPMDILEPGGTIIVASEISEGFGSPEYRAAQERLVALGPDAFLDTLLAKSHADVDEWQTEMQLKPMRVGTIQLYAPNMPEEDRRITGVEMVDSLEDAIAAAVARAGDPDVAVILKGPYVVPFARGA